jgi:hypothetical protein
MEYYIAINPISPQMLDVIMMSELSGIWGIEPYVGESANERVYT